MYKSNKFCDILKIDKGITALIGSGGKTSMMMRLAAELSEKGKTVICTTTHILRPDNMPVVETLDELVSLTDYAGQVCIGTGCADNPRKLTVPECGAEILADHADYVVAEADGSRMHPLKIHRSFEPVIPGNCNRVIWVIGLSGIGKPAGDAFHCAELLEGLTGISPEAEVTPETVVAVIAAELKTCSGFDVCIYMNQTDVEDGERKAEALAANLRQRAEYSDFERPAEIYAGSLKEGYIYKI